MRSSDESALISNNIIALSVDISSIHSSLTSLITEKDPDILEASIAKVKDKFNEVTIDIKECKFDCKKIEDIYKNYQQKVTELIDQRILLGKTSEAIEFFIQDLSPVYFNALTELDHKGDEVKKSTAETLKKSQTEAMKLKLGIITSSIFMILLLSIGGFSFKKTLVAVLSQITEKLESSTVTLRETSQKVASTSDFLSESSTEQNSTIQGTSQAIQEISAMTDINRNNVVISTNNAKESLKKISEGKKAIESMLEAIKRISHSNNQMVDQINKNDSEFGEVINLIKEIDQKTKIINDIVFQTKLLSFNASVEAARAGEHGKGFAVVAEEIGNLAVMSGQAANEISELLNNSVKRVNEIVTNSQGAMTGIMEIGKSTINEGNDAVTQCHEIFDHISEDSQSINSILEEINAGTLEQSKGIEEVNKSMLQINDVATRSAQIAQESLEMSSRLKEQSGSIAELAGDLSLMLHGKDKLN